MAGRSNAGPNARELSASLGTLPDTGEGWNRQKTQRTPQGSAHRATTTNETHTTAIASAQQQQDKPPIINSTGAGNGKTPNNNTNTITTKKNTDSIVSSGDQQWVEIDAPFGRHDSLLEGVPESFFQVEQARAARAQQQNQESFSFLLTPKDQWMPDRMSVACFGCQSTFNAWRRRHHCRLCGKIFCNKCCPSRMKNWWPKATRSCQTCFDSSKPVASIPEIRISGDSPSTNPTSLTSSHQKEKTYSHKPPHHPNAGGQQLQTHNSSTSSKPSVTLSLDPAYANGSGWSSKAGSFTGDSVVDGDDEESETDSVYRGFGSEAGSIGGYGNSRTSKKSSVSAFSGFSGKTSNASSVVYDRATNENDIMPSSGDDVEDKTRQANNNCANRNYEDELSTIGERDEQRESYLEVDDKGGKLSPEDPISAMLDATPGEWAKSADALLNSTNSSGQTTPTTPTSPASTVSGTDQTTVVSPGKKGPEIVYLSASDLAFTGEDGKNSPNTARKLEGMYKQINKNKKKGNQKQEGTLRPKHPRPGELIQAVNKRFEPAYESLDPPSDTERKSGAYAEVSMNRKSGAYAEVRELLGPNGSTRSSDRMSEGPYAYVNGDDEYETGSEMTDELAVSARGGVLMMIPDREDDLDDLENDKMSGKGSKTKCCIIL